MQTLSTNTQATLLLTAYFGNASKAAAKPLTNTEWARLAVCLHQNSLQPSDLLAAELPEPLLGRHDKTIHPDRLRALLDRGSAMAVALDKWLGAGLWILTRADPEYPKRLKQHLKRKAPPLFFGCGNRQLLGRGGLAVVGSRNAGEDDLNYSRQLGAKAAATGLSIISGGAGGVDESAMLGALEAEGTAVGVLFKGLLRATSSRMYRGYLRSNDLVLISPFNPEAGFNAGNAMQRNKYIYCLADAAVAVRSGPKGGTWNGVKENLRECWIPMWVKENTDPKAGNQALIAEGAKPLPIAIEQVDVKALLSAPDIPAPDPQSLFIRSAATHAPSQNTKTNDVHEPSPCAADSRSAQSPSASPETAGQPKGADQVIAGEPDPPIDTALYDHFLALLEQLTQAPREKKQLETDMGLHSTQLNLWLKQAVAEKHVTKLMRPVRYQWTAPQEEATPDLFSKD